MSDTTDAPSTDEDASALDASGHASDSNAENDAENDAGPDLDDVPFEEALNRLEAIVDDLEGDAGTLEESLDAYEEGVAIARACLSRLDDAEQRVSELSIEG